MPSQRRGDCHHHVRWPIQQSMVDIKVEEAAGLKAVIVHGELDVSTAPRLADALDSAPGESDLLVDLCGVEFLDCAGVRRLAEARTTQAARSRAFTIACTPTGAVSRLFDTLAAAGFTLPVYRSRAEALRAALVAPTSSPAPRARGVRTSA